MNKSKQFFYALTIITVIFAIYFLRNYLSIIAAACLTVLIFNPVYYSLLKLLRGKKGLATGLTIVVALLAVVIPLVIVTILGYDQVTNVIQDVNNSINRNNSSFEEILQRSIDVINRDLARFSYISYRLTVDKAQEFISNLTGPVGVFIVNFLRGLSGSTFSFFTNLIIYLILLSSIFPNQDKIIGFLKKLSPLSDEIDNLYMRKAKLMAQSMVKGTFVVALVQGILGGIFMKIVGLPYFFFFIVFFTFISIIPLGSGIITIPIAIVMLLTGHIWQGVFLLLSHFLIITNIDNLLRPKLVHHEAKLPEALTLLSVFAGISMFGPLGVIYGPVVMIFIFTTLEIYIKYYAPKFT